MKTSSLLVLLVAMASAIAAQARRPDRHAHLLLAADLAASRAAVASAMTRPGVGDARDGLEACVFLYGASSVPTPRLLREYAAARAWEPARSLLLLTSRIQHGFRRAESTWSRAILRCGADGKHRAESIRHAVQYKARPRGINLAGVRSRCPLHPSPMQFFSRDDDVARHETVDRSFCYYSVLTSQPLVQYSCMHAWPQTLFES
ncbi:hypothetical protein BRADI_4g27753v3 [Brachypodium distachyon]|uniref:Pectinesterase inhibitor domain-containing protein n=1 Tax=Brachypodium distachyon TaxID=15368 RepID=A0A0Q3EU65_BRADI|nr:hypothetical protein BRADI_4g27753v3 [Brachypodium distachyon]